MFKQAHQNIISRIKMAGDAWDKMLSSFRYELTVMFHSSGKFSVLILPKRCVLTKLFRKT